MPGLNTGRGVAEGAPAGLRVLELAATDRSGWPIRQRTDTAPESIDGHV